jgi:hypothetical protein
MFQHYPPPRVERVWPVVERGLKEIQRRVGETNWTPAQVKEALQSGFAGLFICPDGFVVTHVDTEPCSGKPFLNVWLACFKPGKAKARRTEFVAFLDFECFRTLGHYDWRFSSPREGWEGIEPDCEVHLITWRRKR